jgi:hypothetical protein
MPSIPKLKPIPMMLPADMSLQDLAKTAKDRAAFHAEMAAMLDSIAGLCRIGQAPGEVATLMLQTGRAPERIDRELDDMLCCMVLLVQTWQRELRVTVAMQGQHPGVH